ncbi:MAG: CD225/dispanin family protein [Bacteroidaceae bacterium]|nr:CD225/dispanin family protein [Bacteroidaceae bacterium]
MEYFIIENEKQSGPFSWDDLKTKAINANTLIWVQGQEQWKKAAEYPELQSIILNNPPSIPNTETPPSMPQGTQQTCPKTWLAESILATIFCCLPFGIVGIVYAAKVSSTFNEKNYSEAEKTSKQAGQWTKIAFITGITIYALYLTLTVIGVSLINF